MRSASRASTPANKSRRLSTANLRPEQYLSCIELTHRTPRRTDDHQLPQDAVASFFPNNVLPELVGARKIVEAADNDIMDPLLIPVTLRRAPRCGGPPQRCSGRVVHRAEDSPS